MRNNRSTQRKKRVLSGIRPSGRLHIGNYLGAIKSWLNLQEKYECIYMIADYHAITTPFNPSLIQKDIQNVILDYLAAGLDPKKSTIIIQSQVPEHTELAWILETITPKSWLERIPTYKEKIAEHPKYVNVGLFNYPALMAADILIYKAKYVPVGEDQLPHIELAREIARKFNRMFGQTFPLPQAILSKGAKILSLSDPTKKMSKTGDEGIGLADSPQDIKVKIMKAVTDVGPRKGKGMSPGVTNLFTLVETFSSKKTYQYFQKKHKEGTIRYVEMKKALSQDIASGLESFRIKRMELTKNPIYIQKILDQGIKKARILTQATLIEVKKKTGLIFKVKK
jgi:tryptophanyl-tRNA synthetase